MKIDKNTTKKIASLCRIRIEEKEIEEKGIEESKEEENSGRRTDC